MLKQNFCSTQAQDQVNAIEEEAGNEATDE